MPTAEDHPDPVSNVEGSPASVNPDREIARQLLHRMKVSPELRMRFDQVDQRLSTIAFRAPGSGELVLAKSGIRNMLIPLTTPQQAASIIAIMESSLGDRLREDRQGGEWISWDAFLVESGLAQPKPGVARLDLTHAQTSDDVRRAFELAVPASGTTPDVEGKIRHWIDAVCGSATLTDGQTVLDAVNVNAINVNAVTFCIEESVGASWWIVALIALACMILTWPVWWLGLAFAGITVVGWLLVTILNCIITNG